jgi:hypothetical protein
VARRSHRVKASLPITAAFAGLEGTIVCRTRDVSVAGMFLEVHGASLSAGMTVTASIFDDARGEVVEVVGEIARVVEPGHGQAAGVGVRLVEPSESWDLLVGRLAMAASRAPDRPSRRLRILVVGDEARRRGAMALYVKSGWDVRFASDLAGTREALSGFRIDAIVAEIDLDDARWPRILDEVRRQQPQARRLVRSALGGRELPPPGAPNDLVHRVVDLDAGLDAFVQALSD